MNVIFAPYVEEASRGWRWPEACQSDPEHYMLDLGDTAAAGVLTSIGFAGETFLDEPLPIRTFASYVDRALHDRRHHPAPEIETSLIELVRIARESRAIGATHIAWS